jgi:hypothetical protein
MITIAATAQQAMFPPFAMMNHNDSLYLKFAMHRSEKRNIH